MDHTVDVFALLYCQGLQRPRSFANSGPNLDEERLARAFPINSSRSWGSAPWKNGMAAVAAFWRM